MFQVVKTAQAEQQDGRAVERLAPDNLASLPSLQLSPQWLVYPVGGESPVWALGMY